MTDIDPTAEELAIRAGEDQLASGGYIQFTIPDIPYSVISVALKPGADPFIAARYLRLKYLAEFAEVLEAQRVEAEQRAADRAERQSQPSGNRDGQRGGGNNRRRSDPNAPKCREHRSPMKRNRNDDGWFCPRSDRDGYCEETIED